MPILLCVLTLALWFGLQLYETYALQQLRQGLLLQQTSVDEATRLCQSLDALAADTQRMADGGDAHAALLVAALNKRGETIQVPAKTTGSPPAKR